MRCAVRHECLCSAARRRRQRPCHRHPRRCRNIGSCVGLSAAACHVVKYHAVAACFATEVVAHGGMTKASCAPGSCSGARVNTSVSGDLISHQWNRRKQHAGESQGRPKAAIRARTKCVPYMAVLSCARPWHIQQPAKGNPPLICPPKQSHACSALRTPRWHACTHGS